MRVVAVSGAQGGIGSALRRSLEGAGTRAIGIDLAAAEVLRLCEGRLDTAVRDRGGARIDGLGPQGRRPGQRARAGRGSEGRAHRRGAQRWNVTAASSSARPTRQRLAAASVSS